MRVLDLYCGEGGAGKGYFDARFDVTGVDKVSQPRYPFSFVQADALEYLSDIIVSGEAEKYDFIHASPPCQYYSVMSKCNPHLLDSYEDLIEPTRELLILSNRPYVIENVNLAPLENPITLCGTMFDRRYNWPGKGLVELRRHRGFESTFDLTDPSLICDHRYYTVTVTGHGGGSAVGKAFAVGKGYADAARAVMGIDWMTRRGLTESIPPVYTHYLGNSIRRILENEAR